jgi:hypothetical protein
VGTCPAARRRRYDGAVRRATADTGAHGGPPGLRAVDRKNLPMCANSLYVAESPRATTPCARMRWLVVFSRGPQAGTSLGR